MKMHKPGSKKKRNFCQSLAELELKEGIPDPTLFFYETPFPRALKKRSLTQEDLVQETKASQEHMSRAQADFNALRDASKALKEAYEKLSNEAPNQ